MTENAAAEHIIPSSFVGKTLGEAAKAEMVGPELNSWRRRSPMPSANNFNPADAYQKDLHRAAFMMFESAEAGKEKTGRSKILTME